MTTVPEIGHTIGNYRVISRLGAGGMGEVWIGEHQLLGRRAAIKILLPKLSRQPEVVERFFDEARAATQIPDPGIVHVYDFGWHDGEAYIAMELLVGESLSTRIARQSRIPIASALRLAHQIALTMSVAHARGIVHRDLKPDNVFVVSDPAVPGGERIKILDFGIAKLLGDHSPSASRTQSGVILGTPMYMSPEQCRGASTVDHRTDVYALGCILYVLICGRPPFVNDTTGDMIASHLMEEPEPPSTHVSVSAALDELVLRCLAKSVEDRFGHMTEVANRLEALLGEVDPGAASLRPSRPVVAAPSRSGAVAIGELTTLAPPQPRTRRRPWIIGGAIAAGLVATFLVVRGFASSSGDASTSAIDAQLPRSAVQDAPVLAPPDVARGAIDDAGVDAVAVDAGASIRDGGVRRAPRKDARSGSGSAYLDP